LKYRIKKVVCENWEFHEQPTQVKMVFLLWEPALVLSLLPVDW
jgi:hypothetical protein